MGACSKSPVKTFDQRHFLNVVDVYLEPIFDQRAGCTHFIVVIIDFEQAFA